MSSKNKKGVLLVNLGTPDSPSVPDVRKYLREFLMDERVIDIPFFSRWMLINFVIAPFRAPKSAKEYNKLWDERGSPLKYYGEDLKAIMQERLGSGYQVELAMRYQSPSIEEAMARLKKGSVGNIVVLPMFPQYASASTGSVIQKVNEIANTWQTIPSLKFISNFTDHPLFIEAFAENARKLMAKQDYDYVVFSYHGLPERQIKKGSDGGYCQIGEACCSKYHAKNKYCYRAQCFETSRLLGKALNLEADGYTTTFQSRLGKDPWIKPYTDVVLQDLPAKGLKKVLVFSPAFIADCLETTIEVGEQFKEEFFAAGGEVWDLVPSLNVEPKWVDCVEALVK